MRDCTANRVPALAAPRPARPGCEPACYGPRGMGETALACTIRLPPGRTQPNWSPHGVIVLDLMLCETPAIQAAMYGHGVCTGYRVRFFALCLQRKQ
eukprot:3128200-Prymnesium_polylepis.1